MEVPTCDICFIGFSVEFCVPKVLECGHTICLKCLVNVLQYQKICPTCRKELTKTLEECPTNFILLKNDKSSEENFYSDYQEKKTLTEKVNSLLSKKEAFKNSIEKKISSLKSELVAITKYKYSSLQNELITSTDKKFSSLKNELVATTEQKYFSFKNQLETSVDEKFSSLKTELMTTTEEKYSSLKKEMVTSSNRSISSLTNEITNIVKNFERMFHKKVELYDAVELKELMEEIDRHSEEKKIFHSSFGKERIMIRLSQYKNEKQFLYDLVVRLQNDEKIYACELIGIDGWRYGEITFSENRIHIHCLSSDTIGNDVFVVPFRDLRECICSKEDLLPFIRIGNQKLIFTLTENLTFKTLHVIKLFTGEGGQTLKGIIVGVDKHYPEKKYKVGNNYLDSLDFNICGIRLPTTINGSVYEDVLYEKRLYKMNKEDVILLSIKEFVYIYKVPEMNSDRESYNVVGKLHKDFQIDFDEMRNTKVENSGICFSL